MPRIILFLAMSLILTVGCSSTKLLKSPMPAKRIADYLGGYASPDRRMILKTKISWWKREVHS
jgi:hypothetical protein